MKPKGTTLIEPGIFERTFPRPTLEATLDAVTAHGVRHIQLDLASAGLDSMPAQIPNDIARRIAQAAHDRNIAITAVSGTWNMIHPDRRERDAGLAALRAIAGACHAMGTSIITLCTGTRDADSMWKRHPENDDSAAWRDLIAVMTSALDVAEAHDVTLAFEPEPANVVSRAARGRDLLREIGNPRLKVVMDPANIVATDRTRPPELVLDEAFELLGSDVVVAHGKDLSADGAFCAMGQGIVPWDHCLIRFRTIGFEGPIILHSLLEGEVPASIAFLRDRIDGEATA